MSAGTQKAAQGGGIKRERRLGEGAVPHRKGQNPGTGSGRAGASRGRSSPPGPSRPPRARRGGRRAATATGGEPEREGELWLGGRRGHRGPGSRMGVGVGRWSASLLPAGTRRRATPGPLLPREGCGRRASPVLRGCHGRAPTAPPHLGAPARDSALRLPGLSNTRRGGSLRRERPGARGPRAGRTKARAAAPDPDSGCGGGKAWPRVF